MSLKHLLIATTFMACAIPAWTGDFPLKTGLDLKEVRKIEVGGVKIGNFTGQVMIQSTGSDKTVGLSLKGPDDLLKQVVIKEEQGNVYIGFEKEVPTLKDLGNLNLTVEMPAKMPLEMTLVGGKAVVGPRESNDNQINLNGFGDIKIESVRNIDTKIDGSGEITIVKIEGDAKISIRGDGKYVLQQGTIPHLEASIQGTGLIDVMANVIDAYLVSEGAGTMKLANVKGKLSQSMSGASTISIDKVTGSLKNKVSGSGQFDLNKGCHKKKG